MEIQLKLPIPFYRAESPCFTKTSWKWETASSLVETKPTRIISAKLHEQLLEDVCILSEEQAVGLGKHLVHGLLRKFYKVSEEICKETWGAEIEHKSVTLARFL